jgi:hypothetical protein
MFKPNSDLDLIFVVAFAKSGADYARFERGFLRKLNQILGHQYVICAVANAIENWKESNHIDLLPGCFGGGADGAIS